MPINPVDPTEAARAVSQTDAQAPSHTTQTQTANKNSASEKAKPAGTDSVQITNASRAAAQEATETPAQTELEASQGDSQAQALLDSQAATKAANQTQLEKEASTKAATKTQLEKEAATIAANQAQFEKDASNKTISDKALSDKALSDKALSDQVISDKAIADKVASQAQLQTGNSTPEKTPPAAPQTIATNNLPQTAVQETRETIPQTTKEADLGDRQAQAKLDKEAAAKEKAKSSPLLNL
ncbi:MAG: hypothetical protein HQM08_07555 [Candidatus Riflebacteria bacterium]|nr:hypothetical protein [Candidatus Riflebacteria bacterium]